LIGGIIATVLVASARKKKRSDGMVPMESDAVDPPELSPVYHANPLAKESLVHSNPLA